MASIKKLGNPTPTYVITTDHLGRLGHSMASIPVVVRMVDPRVSSRTHSLNLKGRLSKHHLEIFVTVDCNELTERKRLLTLVVEMLRQYDTITMATDKLMKMVTS